MKCFARLVLAASAAALAIGARTASAGETACWFEGAQLVAAASVHGIAGDYIIDTGTARTQLHDTRTQGAGLSTPEDTAVELRGEVRFAGLRRTGQTIEVADLDARSVAMPTPIAGVIGADVLSHYVVDIRFAPCRLAVWRTREAPAVHAGLVVPLRRMGGRPAAEAAVSDGTRARRGRFILATGQDLAVRLDEHNAQVPSATDPKELYPGGIGAARLSELSFAGDLIAELLAGLLLAEAVPHGVEGVIGAPVLAGHAWRFDFPHGRLLMLED
ncbi:MAG: hypothetical protein Q8M88_13575 [Phenylobacterium sp.]|uniref:hypothetical protein n=1 Tax=Phenylobacterium sp. TaxID=1871053 RepID=UPI0027347C1E|nr:hypothetical protein [Phenylobacterium sp.]MDP3175458.1 hypothetical protein [Phenylobacterium sp.]